MRRKTLLIVIALVLLLAGVLVFSWRRNQQRALSVSEAPRSVSGPSFDILVEQPIFNSRPPWEIPGVILGLSERGPRLDQNSPGVTIGYVTAHHLELRADGGWDLLIETDSEGRIISGTHVAFPIKLGGRPLRFNCRPAKPAVGYLSSTMRPDSDEVDGSFALELTTCINAQSGKIAQWPYKPLPVRGSFSRLPAEVKGR